MLYGAKFPSAPRWASSPEPPSDLTQIGLGSQLIHGVFRLRWSEVEGRNIVDRGLIKEPGLVIRVNVDPVIVVL